MTTSNIRSNEAEIADLMTTFGLDAEIAGVCVRLRDGARSYARAMEHDLRGVPPERRGEARAAIEREHAKWRTPVGALRKRVLVARAVGGWVRGTPLSPEMQIAELAIIDAEPADVVAEYEAMFLPPDCVGHMRSVRDKPPPPDREAEIRTMVRLAKLDPAPFMSLGIDEARAAIQRERVRQYEATIINGTHSTDDAPASPAAEAREVLARAVEEANARVPP